MKLKIAAALAVASMASGALAESHSATTGDAAAGEKAFNKCKSCHLIVADDGTSIVKGGRTGPNLYGIAGRQAGTFEGFKYGDDIVAAGEAGLVWNEEAFSGFVQNPKKYLGEVLDNKGARTKMSFRLKKGAEDIYAYLLSVGPQG